MPKSPEILSSIAQATEGALDNVPIESLKSAQAALLADIETNHKAVVTELTKGDKPSDETKKTILAAANKIARQYHKVEAKTEDVT